MGIIIPAWTRQDWLSKQKASQPAQCFEASLEDAKWREQPGCPPPSLSPPVSSETGWGPWHSWQLTDWLTDWSLQASGEENLIPSTSSSSSPPVISRVSAPSASARWSGSAQPSLSLIDSRGWKYQISGLTFRKIFQRRMIIALATLGPKERRIVQP